MPPARKTKPTKRHAPEVTRAWRQLAEHLWNGLADGKVRRLEATGLGRSIITLIGGTDQIGPDRAERFRAFINGEYRAAVLPPPFVTIDSQAEFAWLELLGDRAGDEASTARAFYLAKLIMDAEHLGALEDGKVVDVLEKEIAWRKLRDQSGDDLDALPNRVTTLPQPASEPSDTTQHGKRKEAPSGDGRKGR